MQKNTKLCSHDISRIFHFLEACFSMLKYPPAVQQRQFQESRPIAVWSEPFYLPLLSPVSFSKPDVKSKMCWSPPALPYICEKSSFTKVGLFKMGHSAVCHGAIMQQQCWGTTVGSWRGYDVKYFLLYILSLPLPLPAFPSCNFVQLFLIWHTSPFPSIRGSFKDQISSVDCNWFKKCNEGSWLPVVTSSPFMAACSKTQSHPY